MPPRKKAPQKRTMSDEHKEALAQGRAEGRAVRAYLEALETHRPKRGRKRTPDSIQNRLDRIEVELPDADPMNRLSLIQERMNLEAELSAMDNGVDLAALEAGFIEHAWNYSQRKGISAAAWRSLGVPRSVLREAGIA